jgi:hypothetical protein
MQIVAVVMFVLLEMSFLAFILGVGQFPSAVMTSSYVVD